ncbi:chorismate-binding protein, partial [Acinetobacter baumannii]
PAAAAYARAVERISNVLDDLDKPVDKSGEAADDALNVPMTSNTPKETYLEMVSKAKDYIAAGDIFQVVLSQRFEAPFSLPPFSLYRALRRV